MVIFSRQHLGSAIQETLLEHLLCVPCSPARHSLARVASANDTGKAPALRGRSPPQKTRYMCMYRMDWIRSDRIVLPPFNCSRASPAQGWPTIRGQSLPAGHLGCFHLCCNPPHHTGSGFLVPMLRGPLGLPGSLLILLEVPHRIWVLTDRRDSHVP